MEETDIIVTISVDSHNVVMDEQHNPIMDNNNKVLLCRISDNALQFIAKDVVESVFGSFHRHHPHPIEIISSNPEVPINIPYPEVLDNPYYDPSTMENIEETDLIQTAASDVERKNWTRPDILKLIDIYKAKIDLFQSSSVRNEKIWKLISQELQGFSAEQCKNKFKYLKAKYIKKKDNMSSKATGQKKIAFEYFGEFEELFSKKPNIIPVAVASSSKINPVASTSLASTSLANIGNESPSDDPTEDIPINERIKKKKSDKVSEELKHLREQIHLHEENKQRRHEELMKQREEALNIFKEYIEVLKKK